MNRGGVIQQWGKQSVIQAPKSASPRETRSDEQSAAAHKTYTPTAVFPPSHDAFQTLVNAAAAQQSLAVPGKDDRRSTPTSIAKDVPKAPPKDIRPSAEGLAGTLIDMHRPRPFVDAPGMSQRAAADLREAQLRDQRAMYRPEEKRNWAESEREFNERERAQRVRQIFSTDAPENDKKRLDFANEHDRERIIVASNHAAAQNVSALRLANNREPFTKEQFERELRHPDPTIKKTLEDAKDSSYKEHFRLHQQQLADNEASRIFSASFQKDNAPKATATRTGFTAANLIDAIITHQINQTADAPRPSGVPGKEPPFEVRDKPRDEVMIVPDGDGPRREHRDELPRNNVPTGLPQNLTLGEHIATIISKNYSDEAKSDRKAPSELRPDVVPPRVVTSPHKSLEGIAAVASVPVDHNWKLRRALQQEKDDDRPTTPPHDPTKPSSRPSSRSHTPSARHTPSTTGVEPISPPRPRSHDGESRPWPDSRPAGSQSLPTSLAQSPATSTSSGPRSVPATTTAANSANQNLNLSPLDYVKNRIVEVMRTTSDDNSGESSKRSSVDSCDKARSSGAADNSRPSSRDSLNSKGPSLVPSPAPPLVTEGLGFRSGRTSAAADEAPAAEDQDRKDSRSASPHIPRKRIRLSNESDDKDGPPALIAPTPPRDTPNGITTGREVINESERVDSPSSPGEMVIDESSAATPSSTSPAPVKSDNNGNGNSNHRPPSASLDTSSNEYISSSVKAVARPPSVERHSPAVVTSSGQVFGKLSTTTEGNHGVGGGLVRAVIRPTYQSFPYAATAASPATTPPATTLKSPQATSPAATPTAPVVAAAAPEPTSASGPQYEPLSDDE